MTAIYFTWTGDAMVPLPRALNYARRQFVKDAEYRLDVHEERSPKSHQAYMAEVHRAWKNLPEKMSTEFATPDHLRKRALIKCGFSTKKYIDCDSPRDARAVAVLVGEFDEFAYVEVRGKQVMIARAQSQNYAHMDKETFERSKRAVLDLLSLTIGVTYSELKKEGERG